MKFTLEIELGNETMNTEGDIALSLRRLAVKLDGHTFSDGADAGRIIGLNGNTVGRWEVA